MSTALNKEISEGYRASGLSRKAFAHERGISEATLAYHLKRVGASDTFPERDRFTHLEVAEVQDKIVITTSGGTTIEIPI